MKIVIFILSTSILHSYCAAQTNAFAPLGATWYYDDIYDIDTDDTIYITGYNQVESISDTLISDKICRKLKFSYIDSEGLLDPENNYYYLYENNEKVYFHLEEKFLLLYDFSGDDWYAHDIFYESGDSTLITVDSVTFELYDGVSLKTIHTHHDLGSNLFFLSNKVVEKIGPLCYLFLYNGGDDSFPPTNLRCYKDSEIDIRINPDIACDSLIPEITNLQSTTPININIYVHDHIVHLMNILEPIEVTLINLLGEEVVDSFIITHDISFNCSNLITGSYIIILKNSNNIYSQQILIL